MSTTVADTSFLFTLYGNDAHTAGAHGWVRQSQRPPNAGRCGSVEHRALVGTMPSADGEIHRGTG